MGTFPSLKIHSWFSFSRSNPILLFKKIFSQIIQMLSWFCIKSHRTYPTPSRYSPSWRHPQIQEKPETLISWPLSPTQIHFPLFESVPYLCISVLEATGKEERDSIPAAIGGFNGDHRWWWIAARSKHYRIGHLLQWGGLIAARRLVRGNCIFVSSVKWCGLSVWAYGLLHCHVSEFAAVFLTECVEIALFISCHVGILYNVGVYFHYFGCEFH